MATKKRLHQTFDEVQEILDRALVQPDWNETDPESDAYIRNRPFGEEGESDPAMLLWDGEWGAVREFYLNYGDEYIQIYRHDPYQLEDWADESGRRKIKWRVGDDLVFTDNDGVYPSVTIEGFFPGRTPQPYDLGFEIGEVTTRKLDNKYLDLDSSPVEDSPKPVTSGGVYEALTGKASIRSGSTLYWDSVTYVPKSGEVIIYTDKAQKDGVYIPGVKIGTGNAYVQDLPFIDDAVADSLVTHINNTNMHITSEERSRWDNKLNVDDDYAVVNKTLIFNRN